MSFASFLQPLLALLLAPLLLGVINRTKAFFAGRSGAPLLQPYHDLWKLLRKGAVYSRTTTWIFRLAPAAGLACTVVALLFVPSGGFFAPLAFSCDFVLFAYFLGLARFATVLAALDTGSSFEGMGASREVMFSALAEPALFLALAPLATLTRSLSLSQMMSGISPSTWKYAFPALLLVGAALSILLLVENGRIPVEDPDTHLELTMIREVMVLDHGGPDLAMLQYASALKLWGFSSLIVGLVLPFRPANPWLSEAVFLAGLFVLALSIGVLESSRARLRLNRVPKFIGTAAVLAALALLLMLR